MVDSITDEATSEDNPRSTDNPYAPMLFGIIGLGSLMRVWLFIDILQQTIEQNS